MHSKHHMSRSTQSKEHFLEIPQFFPPTQCLSRSGIFGEGQIPKNPPRGRCLNTAILFFFFFSLILQNSRASNASLQKNKPLLIGFKIVFKCVLSTALGSRITLKQAANAATVGEEGSDCRAEQNRSSAKCFSSSAYCSVHFGAMVYEKEPCFSEKTEVR